MSGINSTVRINDGMSPALKSMNKALNIVLSSFEKLQSVSANAIDTSDIAAARAELNSAAIAVQRLEDNLSQAEDEQEQFTREVKNSNDAMSGLVHTVGGLIASYASFQTLMGAVNLSDQMTQTESRMNLIVDTEAGESVDELTAKIMDSANRSRSYYMDTANAVTSFAQRAGDAFSNNDEVIAFTETLNKMYVIAGATQEEQASSMLQLTQALGSGVLRGEEFNAVFEAAPNIMQAVADYMDIPIGQLRTMASEGQITADIVKNAIFDASTQVNEDFEGMNKTWQQVMTSFKNQALKSFKPVLDKINELANNEDIQNFAIASGVALAEVANWILIIFESMAEMGSFVYDNWSWIAPIIYTVAGILGTYYGILLLTKAAEMASAGIKIGMAIASFAVATATGSQASATAVATAAQYGLNTAILSCPIFWILAAIIAIIGVLFLLAGWITEVTGVTISGLGMILAVIYTAIAIIYNLFVSLYNFLGDLIASLANSFIDLAEFFANVWTDPLGSTVRLFGSWANAILGIVKGVANSIDALFGTELASGVQGWMNWVDNQITDNFGEAKIDLPEWEANYLNRWAYEDAAAYGIDGGNLITEWVGEQFSFGGLDELGAIEDSIAGLTQSVAADPYAPEIASNTGGMADNTEDIANAMEITEEDLKYLRDIAEQEAINRFTTAEIKIDMQNNNSINSNMDLDGMVSYLEDKLYESMEIAAEGVH